MSKKDFWPILKLYSGLSKQNSFWVALSNASNRYTVILQNSYNLAGLTCMTNRRPCYTQTKWFKYMPTMTVASTDTPAGGYVITLLPHTATSGGDGLQKE